MDAVQLDGRKEAINMIPRRISPGRRMGARKNHKKGNYKHGRTCRRSARKWNAAGEELSIFA